jgi:hypothetical protein
MTYRRLTKIYRFFLGFTLLACVVFSHSVASAKENTHSFRVFYELYDGEHSVRSDQPKLLTKAEWMPIALMIKDADDRFFGLLDKDGTTLQFYKDNGDKIWVDVPLPHRKGSLGMSIDVRAYEVLLTRIDVPFAEFIKMLPLEFTPW